MNALHSVPQPVTIREHVSTYLATIHATALGLDTRERHVKTVSCPLFEPRCEKTGLRGLRPGLTRVTEDS